MLKSSLIKQSKNITSSLTKPGFTIVELLVVIVVIGILAAITIVSYAGISQRAISASLQSDLANAKKQLQIYQTQNDEYPEEVDDCPTPEEGNLCLQSSSGNSFIGYSVNNTTNPPTFTLDVTNTNGTKYRVTDDSAPVAVTSPTSYTFVMGWGGVGADIGRSLVQTSDGGYAVTGYTESYTAGGYDMFLVKYNSDGSLSWSKTWGGGSPDYGLSLVQTSDGGYAVTGQTQSYTAGNNDMFLAKYTSGGSLSWSKTWGGASNDFGNSLVQTSDGGYVVMGYTMSYTAGGYDIFLVKYTSGGSLSWSKTWGGASNDYGNSLVQTSDGGYAVTGQTQSYTAGGSDMFLVKYTSDGSLSWSKTWGGANTDYGNSLVQTSDGGYAVTGYTASYTAGGNDMFLVKYTSDGTLSWSKTWGGIADDYGNSLVQTNDGGYAVLGWTQSYTAGSNDIFLAKYTSDGTITNCSSPMCQDRSVTGVSRTVTSVDRTVTSVDRTVTSVDRTVTSVDRTVTTMVIVAP